MWLSTKDLPLRTESHKLPSRFVGTFPISKTINPVAVWVKLPRPMRVCSTLVGSSLFMRAPWCWPPLPLLLPRWTPVHLRGRGRQYIVDWEGYGLEERSWISASNILDPDLIWDFHCQHPDLPGLSGEVACGCLCHICSVKSIKSINFY